MTLPDRKVWAYVPDLMDRSRVSAALPGVQFVSQPEGLAPAAEAGDVVIVDLSRAGVLEALRGIAAGRIIGFGSHVERELLAAAREAGCTEVLARSAFFSRLPALLDS